MKLKGIYVYFVQETWLEGDVFDEILNGYHVFVTTEGLAITTSAALQSSYPLAITRAGKPREPDHRSQRMQRENLQVDL